MSIRFAGSKLDLGGLQLSSAGGGTGAAAAADVVDVGDAFAAQRSKSPGYDAISANAMKNRADIEATGIKASADFLSTGVNAVSTAKGNQLLAQSNLEAAEEARKQAKDNAGIQSFTNIAGAALKLFNPLG